MTIDDEDVNWFRNLGNVSVADEKMARNLRLLNTYNSLSHQLKRMDHRCLDPFPMRMRMFLKNEMDGLERLILDRMHKGE